MGAILGVRARGHSAKLCAYPERVLAENAYNICRLRTAARPGRVVMEYWNGVPHAWECR